MEQASSRGGSALTDGCRWVANIKTMDDKTAEKFRVTDPHNFVVLDVTKSNYAPKLPAPIYFRRGAGGALTYVDLAADRVRAIADRLLDRLSKEEAAGRHFSRRDLLYNKEAKHIIDDLRKIVQGFNRVPRYQPCGGLYAGGRMAKRGQGEGGEDRARENYLASGYDRGLMRFEPANSLTCFNSLFLEESRFN